LREITQEIVLAALRRRGILESAGFHGGTCLRIFPALNRFSEDLDHGSKDYTDLTDEEMGMGCVRDLGNDEEG